MFRVVTNILELYYRRRLLSVSSNRLDHFVFLRYTVAGVKAVTIPFDEITSTDDPDVFIVHSQSSSDVRWTVDLKLGECSCPVGYNGQPCKHQLAAAEKYKCYTVNNIPTCSPKGRQIFAAIAMGKQCQDISFYSSVHQKADEEHLSSLSLQVNWADEDIKQIWEDEIPMIQDTTQSTNTVSHECPDSSPCNTRKALNYIQPTSEEESKHSQVKNQLYRVMQDLQNGSFENMPGAGGLHAAVQTFYSNYGKYEAKNPILIPNSNSCLLCTCLEPIQD